MDALKRVGFDFIVLRASANATDLAAPERVSEMVTASRAAGIPHALQLYIGNELVGAFDLEGFTRALERRGLLEGGVMRDGARLLLVEPDVPSAPLPEWKATGFDVVGVNRWQKFDSVSIPSAGSAGTPLSPGELADAGYNYVRGLGYAPTFAPAWMRGADHNLAIVVPGWSLPTGAPTVAEPTLERADGRTLVAQFKAALHAKPRYILVHSWNEEAQEQPSRAT